MWLWRLDIWYCWTTVSAVTLAAPLLLVQFKVLVLTFKALHDLGPGCLKDLLVLPNIPVYPLRTSEGALLQVSPLSQVRGVAAVGQAFSAVVPQLWKSGEIENPLHSVSMRIQNTCFVWHLIAEWISALCASEILLVCFPRLILFPQQYKLGFALFCFIFHCSIRLQS